MKAGPAPPVLRFERCVGRGEDWQRDGPGGEEEGGAGWGDEGARVRGRAVGAENRGRLQGLKVTLGRD